MTMAGHSSFDTTQKFYLAICSDLIDKTREASNKTMSAMSVANVLQVPLGQSKHKKPTNANACRPSSYKIAGAGFEPATSGL
jgi:hypothetical protein